MSSAYFTIDTDTKRKILKIFDKTPENLEQDVEIIKEWLKGQPHLPETPSDKMIEYFVVNNKFSLEKTKQKIDSYYYMKSLINEKLGNTNPKFYIGHTTEYCIPLPKLKDGLYRIIFVKHKNVPVDQFNVVFHIANILNSLEVRIQEDLIVGDIVINDLEHFTFEKAIKITPNQVKLFILMFEKVQSNRMKEIHIINHNRAFQFVLKLARMFAKPKILDRIHMHDSLDSLTKAVPVELLPKDYGGKEKSLDELEDSLSKIKNYNFGLKLFLELWNRKVQEYGYRFDKLEKMKVNEHLRPTPLENCDQFGFTGSFKKLDLD